MRKPLSFALLIGLAQGAFSQGQAPVTFAQFPGQGPDGALVANPAERPLFPGGNPAFIGFAIPVDSQGNRRPDLFACHAVFPPVVEGKYPCRILRPRLDGTLEDISRQAFSGGVLPRVTHPRDVVVRDFNGDGRPDIFLADHGYDAPPFAGGLNVLLVSNGDGTYTDLSSTLPQAADFSHSACSGDVNGDGKPDIYVGNVGSTVRPYFLIGRGDGTFTMTRNGLPDPLSSGQQAFLSCLFVDVDADGHADLVMGAGDPVVHSANSVIYFNDGSGDFSRRPRATLPTGPLGAGNNMVMDIVANDVNGDGLPDLILASTQHAPSYRGMGLQVLVNRGGGVFNDETASRLGPSAVRTTGEWCSFLHLVDFDSDGETDIHCEAPGPDPTLPRFWRNTGKGAWVPLAPDPLPPNLREWHIHFVDFDGDGRLDLLRVQAVSAGDVRYHSFRNVSPLPVPREATGNFTSLWWNPAESGWGINFNHQGSIVFGTLFTYDATGAPMWLVLPNATMRADGATFTGELFRTRGPAFNAAPFMPITAADITRVGAMTVAFAESGSATLSYSVNGAAVTKTIQRQVFGSRAANCTATTAGRTSLSHYQDLWWNPAESGWGVNITHQGDTLFATLFTYDAGGRGLWLVMSAGQRQSDGSYLGDLYRTTGPAFNATPFTPIGAANLTTVGNMRLRFSDGNNATLTYSYEGAVVTKQIARQVFSNPVPSCSS